MSKRESKPRHKVSLTTSFRYRLCSSSAARSEMPRLADTVLTDARAPGVLKSGVVQVAGQAELLYPPLEVIEPAPLADRPDWTAAVSR
ncbi:MAG TPA: hypothetical protein VMP01_03875 [Pirellulaceae bacterium]|nr:hypothetical protein [Pirellulaceae bacterium]